MALRLGTARFGPKMTSVKFKVTAAYCVRLRVDKMEDLLSFYPLRARSPGCRTRARVSRPSRLCHFAPNKTFSSLGPRCSTEACIARRCTHSLHGACETASAGAWKAKTVAR